MDVLETVIEIVVEYHDVLRKEISSETRFSELENDSLEFSEMIMSCEEAFDVSIPDVVAERMKTIGELVEYIQTQRHPSIWPPAPNLMSDDGQLRER